MKYILIALFFVCSAFLHAQDINILLKEASNYEKQLNETEAYKKYAQVAELDTKNITALVKCTEINCAIGTRQKDKSAKTIYFNAAQTFAQKAYAADSTKADASYAMSLAAAKMTEVAEENKQVVAWVRQSKLYAGKALLLNPGHAKANYTMGKWHYEMTNLSWGKKAAVKTLYGGLPKGDMDSAIYYMEQCRKFDMYFVQNYLDLAKAYRDTDRPALELEVLNKLVKLPNRTPDDAAWKEEGKKMLEGIQ
ncbi:hypothetical protein FRZ67_06315 [Panacibacter ginsenosidivorans]|uniref:Tetratricopeptide repeat protein n=1 Tax=Panacibacter ginsenosidivorans TaxID=1813871 RepID=A0A5B8V6T2_9BACT|nr:hypothetical protein [Panacibacter ginsenosidivorans]QEC66929.1 hypothetical protein FRZ67_06315 [Panacibacter ginsenosidivorans]